MDIYFRSVAHLDSEIQMGHVYWLQPVTGCDSISATANTNGFAPLQSIDRYFNWNRDLINTAAFECNQKREVCVVQLTPPLFLVPATKGHGDSRFLISDLMAATRAAKVKALHFTHFGLLQSRLPRSEVIAILDYLFSNSTSIGLNKIVFDIDSRRETEFYELLRLGTAVPEPV